MSKTIVIIPARLASSRLPKKILLDINGKTMIQRIYENVTAMTDYEVLIAAAENETVEHVNSFGGKAVMTDPDLPSGSDRIAAALSQIDPKGDKYDIVVNFQGDAINTNPQIINDLVELLKATDADLTTPGMIMDRDLHEDPNAVKIVAGFEEDKDEAKCLYFTRNRAPFDRSGEVKDLYHHIGIYAYKAEALKKFVSLPVGVLENREKLEQLRALENGMSIYAKLVKKLKLIEDAPADIDTQEELEETRKYIRD